MEALCGANLIFWQECGIVQVSNAQISNPNGCSGARPVSLGSQGRHSSGGWRALHWTTAAFVKLAETKAGLLHQFRPGFGCCRIVWLWLMLSPVPQGLWWGTKCFGERESSSSDECSFLPNENKSRLIQPIHHFWPHSVLCGKLPSFLLWNSLVRQEELGTQFNGDGTSPSLLRDPAGAKPFFSSSMASLRAVFKLCPRECGVFPAHNMTSITQKLSTLFKIK